MNSHITRKVSFLVAIFIAISFVFSRENAYATSLPACLSLASFLFLNQYGSKNYRAALSINLFVNSIISAFIFSGLAMGDANPTLLSSKWFWIMLIALTILTYLFATILTYVLFFGALYLTLMMLFIAGDFSGSVISSACLLASGFLTYLIRNHIKWMALGLLAGICLAGAIWLSTSWMVIDGSSPKHIVGVLGFIYAAGIGFGIFMQYKENHATDTNKPLSDSHSDSKPGETGSLQDSTEKSHLAPNEILNDLAKTANHLFDLMKPFLNRLLTESAGLIRITASGLIDKNQPLINRIKSIWATWTGLQKIIFCVGLILIFVLLFPSGKK